MFVAEVQDTMVAVDAATLTLWQEQGNCFMWNDASIKAAVERVNRGAALLDRENPGWEENVAPAKLRMYASDFCIIGQVYGDYEEHVGIPFGLAELDWDDDDFCDELAVKARAHGFLNSPVSEDTPVPFPLLDRVWVYLLTARAHADRKVYLTV